MAQFVARVGPNFEEKVLTKERNNPKFGFIQPSNPYHAYYKKQVASEKFKKGTSIFSDKIIEYCNHFFTPFISGIGQNFAFI